MYRLLRWTAFSIACLFCLSGLVAAQEVFEETSHYINHGHSFSFAYPADWFVHETDGLVIVTNQEEVSELTAPQPDEMVLMVNAFTLHEDYADSLTLIDLLHYSAQGSAPYTNIREIEIEGHSAAIAEATWETGSSVAVVRDMGAHGFAFVVATGAAESLEQLHNLALDTAASIDLLSPNIISPDTSDLRAIYENANTGLQFRYPQGWVVNTSNQQIMLLSAEGLNVGMLPPPGEMIIAIGFAARSGLTAELHAADPATVLNSMIVDGAPHGPVTLIELSGRPAAWATVHDERISAMDAIVAVNSDTLMMIRAVGAPDEVDELRAVTLAIASTVIYEEPEPVDVRVDPSRLEGLYISVDGRLSLRHPVDWTIVSDESRVITLSNRPDVESGHLSAGQVVVLLDIATTSRQSLNSIDLVRQMALRSSLPLSQPYRLNLNGREVVRADLQSNSVQGMQLVIALDRGTFATLNVFAAEDAPTSVEDDVFALAASIEYSARMLGR